MFTLLAIVFTLVCAFLVFVIIIQPSQGEGLASAFGGGGGESFFGTKAGQHINRFTIVLAIVFLLLAIVINKLNNTEPKGSSSIMQGVSAPAGQQPLPPSNAQPPAQPPSEQPTTPPSGGQGQ